MLMTAISGVKSAKEGTYVRSILLDSVNCEKIGVCVVHVDEEV